ncbi:MAG: DUF3849 domain-containing protein [Oscillospiraceae bacterium]|nr:DUF3849 domain-containing protein [Oscillospiraceae bacterium]
MNVYSKSREDARELGEITLWRESKKLNTECARAIEQTIREHFDGMHLADGSEQPVIQNYGFDRTMWVLAATVKYKDHDGRFSASNRKWANTVLPVWLPREEFAGYVCDAHPAVLDGFIREVCKAYDALPQMQIRIFQIRDDTEQPQKRFRNYEETQQFGGVDASTYQQIYGGTVNCKTLEEVYALCNCRHPPGYVGRSLSVSDVVEICSGKNKGFYFCDSFGFQKIGFDIDKTDHADMLKVLICEPEKEVYRAEIRDELKALQSAVGGLIEPIYFDPAHKALVYCDEEFLFKDYAPNRMVGDCLVHGTFLIVGDGENDEGERISVSLTDEQMEQFSEQFRYPLIYLERGSLELSEEEAEALDFSQT